MPKPAQTKRVKHDYGNESKKASAARYVLRRGSRSDSRRISAPSLLDDHY